MNFETWEPVYEAILADFGFERAADERARDVLADLVGDETLVPGEVTADTLEGKTVAVAGGADRLARETEIARGADVVFAASTAADVLRDRGIAVDCMVTDLDKNPGTVRELTAAGRPVAVHAHGDNVPKLRAHLPEFEHAAVLPTTQAAPAGPVHNVGGFTDGDRAAFLADHLGAGRLVFPGWDFDDPTVGAEKRAKLRWAERLLRWLELRRDERFSVLDGRRDDVDTTSLPV